ncbi:transcription initiation protein SPT3 homolog [Hydractinia symbiolongicarpus]|uniref:transcription initiation protein SPT3 homolog n=1 Tax=Hydractinia symbiolongicarpus TaxID=13093 RepID=UPI002550A6DB|nr:transcription initiation protein SPT3 homolog [Hydractinia symbiolongicarpus]
MTKPVSNKSGKTNTSKSEKKSKNNVKKIHDAAKLKGALTDIGFSSSSVSSPKNGNNKLWSFHTEIAGMMYAFGDCRKPSPEAVTLVEEIVHHQMSCVLVQATEVTNMRGGRFTSIDDILFLMKNNKCKLRQVIRYLRLKDLKTKAVKTTSPEDEDVLDAVVGDTNKGDSGKRLKLAYDFISSIDGTGELIALFDEQDVVDEIKQARLKRAERMSRCLDSQAYMDYSEARQMSFSKKIAKFKDWLGIGTSIDIKASTAVIEIMSYLAYETVNEIVDLALLVKEDQERTNVLSTITPVSINPLSEIAKSSTAKQPIIPKGALPTPAHSPPGTPITPSNTNAQSTSVNLTAPIHGGLASSLGTASLASSLSGLVKPQKTKKKKMKHSANVISDMNSLRIQTSHIREAVRRYTMIRNPITPFAGLSRSTLSKKTLCL